VAAPQQRWFVAAHNWHFATRLAQHDHGRSPVGRRFQQQRFGLILTFVGQRFGTEPHELTHHESYRCDAPRGRHASRQPRVCAGT
jgi:hypothetical protein